jgi:hypothetical protein
LGSPESGATNDSRHRAGREAETLRQGRGARSPRPLAGQCDAEDIQYHLDVYIKVLEAEAQLGRREGITQDEFDRRFAKWLAE